MFEHDRGRDADLVGAGWIVVRFTYRAITARPKPTADHRRRRRPLELSRPSNDQCANRSGKRHPSAHWSLEGSMKCRAGTVAM
jgi:hypothetical protein